MQIFCSRLIERIVLVFLVFSGCLPGFAQFDAVKEYEFRSCTTENLKRFVADVRRDQAEAERRLKEKYPDDPEKAAKAPIAVALKLIETTAVDLQKRAEAGEPLQTLEPVFARTQRLHYSTLAQMYPYEDPPMLVLGWKCGGNFLFGPLKLTTRQPDPNRPLGPARAKLESARLCHPQTGEPVSSEQMSAMTAVEVSRLQPATDHPALRPVSPGAHYDAFLAEITKLVRASGKKTAQFDLSYARRILFFDELKTDASSPKIKAKDRYGVTWRVKWGDEVHSDVVATRLAIELGATYADLKFWSGPGQTLLILPPAKGADAVTTQGDLDRVLKSSKFQFHLRRYTIEAPGLVDARGEPLGAGRVDQAMIERESLDPKYLGCVFLAFKECQLSLDNPALKRLGGVDLNRGRALDDRVARGMLVFNTWINNPDVKEDNTSGGLLLDPQTVKNTRYVEFISDMGASFAGPYSAGCLSTLSPNCVGEVFQTQMMKLHPVFLPNCWRHCTWADARWMARRIGQLTREDLERVFADSGWPVYSQQLGVEKMLARRNDLVRTFGLTEEGLKILSCNPQLTIKVTTPDGSNTPVVRGMINPLSKLVQEDERTTHPEGLFVSRARQFD